jgi:hypothetical protein
VVSQIDYERNPWLKSTALVYKSFYWWIYVWMIKFLKPTWIPIWKQFAFRQKALCWIYDGFRYATWNILEENHPNTKMLASASTFLLLKSYNLTNLDFNEQYSYFYMLMARKNLDQPLGDPKNSLIKFNEQTSKYRGD